MSNLKGRSATWSYPADPCPAGPSDDYRYPPVDHAHIRQGQKCPGCGETVIASVEGSE